MSGLTFTHVHSSKTALSFSSQTEKTRNEIVLILELIQIWPWLGAQKGHGRPLWP